MSDASVPSFPPSIGAQRVCDLVGGVSDLRGRSLESLSGDRIEVDEDTATSLVRRAAAAWKTPLDEMTCEQLRLLVGQDMGIEWLGPIACQLVRSWPMAMVTFYPGDLAYAVLRRFASVLASDPIAARAVLAGDFGWIDGLLRTDKEYGAGFGADAAAALTEARRIAGVGV